MNGYRAGCMKTAGLEMTGAAWQLSTEACKDPHVSPIQSGKTTISSAADDGPVHHPQPGQGRSSHQSRRGPRAHRRRERRPPGPRDTPRRLLQDFLDAVAADTAAVRIGRVYRFDQIAETHTDMEQNRVSGKLVVTT